MYSSRTHRPDNIFLDLKVDGVGGAGSCVTDNSQLPSLCLLCYVLSTQQPAPVVVCSATSSRRCLSATSTSPSQNGQIRTYPSKSCRHGTFLLHTREWRRRCRFLRDRAIRQSSTVGSRPSGRLIFTSTRSEPISRKAPAKVIIRGPFFVEHRSRISSTQVVMILQCQRVATKQRRSCRDATTVYHGTAAQQNARPGATGAQKNAPPGALRQKR